MEGVLCQRAPDAYCGAERTRARSGWGLRRRYGVRGAKEERGSPDRADIRWYGGGRGAPSATDVFRTPVAYEF
jgi:hypothetical protein